MLAATHNGEWIPKVFVGVYLASAAFDFIFLALRNPKNDGGRRAPLSRDEADDRPQTKRFWIGMYDAISR